MSGQFCWQRFGGRHGCLGELERRRRDNPTRFAAELLPSTAETNEKFVDGHLPEGGRAVGGIERVRPRRERLKAGDGAGSCIGKTRGISMGGSS
jgi:hypothetical protein